MSCLFTRGHPFHLKAVLDTWYWKEGVSDINLNRLWEDFCRYPYFSRLLSEDVLRQTVAAGMASRDFFGYASGKEGDKYLGLCLGTPGTVYLDADSLVVNPKAAEAQQERDRQEMAEIPADMAPKFPGDTEGVGVGRGETNEAGSPYINIATMSQGKLFTRFHAAAELDPVKAGLQFSKIMEEVVQHFSSKIGVDVTISLEIEAVSGKGFPEPVRRRVSENAKTLGFKHADFEED